MINLKKILTATDFSPHSDVAITYAAEFSKKFGAEVVLCHVMERPDLITQLPPVSEGYFPPNFGEIQEQHAHTHCQGVLAKAGLSNARIVLRQGNPYVEIVRTAREENADLIIIGTHGRGMIAHVLLGNVAEKIVRAAPCPVLTVRSGEHEFVMP